jgi:hypothetical protein
MKYGTFDMKLSGTIILAAVFTFFITSCDKLSSPYYTVKGGGGDTTKIVRKILLEDYTGHKCTNCPAASITAHTLETSYSPQVIVMAVHAGYFALPGTGPYTANYSTPVGETWFSDFAIPGSPSGMIDRKMFGGKRDLTPDLWADSLATLVDIPPDAWITITNTYNPSTRVLNTTLGTKFLSHFDQTFNLSVCIVEDSIIGAQKNKDAWVGPVPDIFDYVFMDMLRGTLNGNYGDELASETDTSLVYTKTYSMTLDTAWVAKNCSVLAFVFDAGTNEILQAEKKKIIP